MKICQIVAYVSRDGAYGGPTAVAFAQCDALSEVHEVTLLAGSDGTTARRRPDARYRQAYRRAFRSSGSFGTLVSPSLWWWLGRHGRSFNIVHIHLARDFTVMPAALLLRLLHVPFVVQTHGMVKPAANAVERLYDSVLTAPVIRAARRAFYLTEQERSAVAAFPGHAPLQEIRNAVPLPDVVTSARIAPLEVLFCSRLHRRKRPSLFLEMAIELASACPGRFRFRMVGPDGGELASVRAQLKDLPDSVDMKYDGAVSPHAVNALLRDADVLVLPSIDEPFPMIVLEALASGVPVVVDGTCGLADILSGRAGARVVQSTADSLANAVQEIAADMTIESAGARAIAEREFSITRLGYQLEAAYQEVI